MRLPRHTSRFARGFWKLVRVRFWTVCAVVGIAVTASAQSGLDANQIVGRWWGEGQAGSGTPARFQVEFKPDGILEGGATTAQFGHVTYSDGRWKIQGETLLVEYVASSPTGKSEVELVLRQAGEELTGTGIRKAENRRFNVQLRRVK
jgi:hypothetical protein